MLPEEMIKEEQATEYGKVIKKRKIHEEKRRKRIRAAIMRTGLLAMLLIVSTYAWFTSQKDITLSNLRGTVEVQENMEISLDAKTWHQKIDLSDVSVFTTAQTSRDEALEENAASRTTAAAIMTTELFPVSGMGEKTLAGSAAKFLALYTGKATSDSLTDIEQCEEPTDNGYFAFDIYIKNTSSGEDNDSLQLNLNSAVQVLTRSINKTITQNGVNTTKIFEGDAASGLQNTVRVGLALYGNPQSSTATQKTILEATKDATITDIAIWEPNAYDHVEYIIENNNKLTTLDNGNTVAVPVTAGNSIATYALKETATTSPSSIDNIYDTTSTKLGIQNTFKTDNTKNAAGIVTDYRVKTTDSKPLDIKNITGTDFELTPNSITRLRVYVWLEGQDVDCINVASQGGGIEMDLGLTKDDEVGEVMEDMTTIASATNENIGEYVDLGNDIIDFNGNSDVTTDDWRIFYVDETTDTVYAILSSYLPNSTGYAGAAGLTTGNHYTVISNTDRAALLSGLTDTQNWKALSGGISGATVIGSPTEELFLNSYNEQVADDVTMVDLSTSGMDNSLEKFDVYQADSNAFGYWIASDYADDDTKLWLINDSDSVGTYTYNDTLSGSLGIRPVVALPANVLIKKATNLWTVSD